LTSEQNTLARFGLLLEEETAGLMGIKVGQLRNLRSEGKGPRFVKFGQAVRYRADDVQEYIDSCTRDPSETAPTIATGRAGRRIRA
jgi:hypothetical protein